MSELRFDGRVAIVTGAGRGLGRSHALTLAGRGAKVVVNDVGLALDGSGSDAGPAQEVVDEIRAAGGEAVPSLHDITGPAAAEALVATALDAFGGLDIVVNNAGVNTFTPFVETQHAEMARLLALDPLGGFNVTHAAWPHLVERGYGRIVMTTSAAAFGADLGVAYGTAKASVIGLARSVAATGAPLGIKVNVVAPFGYTRLTTAHPLVTEELAKARELLAPPELVSTIVTVLAHESCPTVGELYVCGAGRVARIFLAQTPGYLNTELTPEDIVEHWSEVFDAPDYTVIGNRSDYVASYYRTIPGWPAAR